MGTHPRHNWYVWPWMWLWLWLWLWLCLTVIDSLTLCDVASGDVLYCDSDFRAYNSNASAAQAATPQPQRNNGSAGHHHPQHSQNHHPQHSQHSQQPVVVGLSAQQAQAAYEQQLVYDRHNAAVRAGDNSQWTAAQIQAAARRQDRIDDQQKLEPDPAKKKKRDSCVIQ